MANSSNIRLSGLKVRYVPGPTTTTRDSAIRVYRSSRIVLHGLTISGGLAINGVPASTPAGGLDATKSVIGLPTARGITLDQSSEVVVDHATITSFFRGIVLANVQKVRVTANYIHALRTSPLTGSGLADVLIEGNMFSESHPWRLGGAGDHGDLIHFWTDHNATAPITGLVIRSNWLRQGPGQALLGIFLEDNGGGGFRDVVIENNLIHNDNRQGMRLENTVGQIVRNTLVQPPSQRAKSAPGILVTNGSNVTVTGNVTGSIDHTNGGMSTDSGNRMVQRFDPAAPGYYAGVFRNALQGGEAIGDFTLIDRAANATGVDLARLRAVLPPGD